MLRLSKVSNEFQEQGDLITSRFAMQVNKMLSRCKKDIGLYSWPWSVIDLGECQSDRPSSKITFCSCQSK